MMTNRDEPAGVGDWPAGDRPDLVLRALRDGTRALHAIVDNASLLTDPALTEQGYLDHAEAARQWFHGVEGILMDANWGGWPAPMLCPRRFEKAAWIEQDLLAGGRSVSDLQGCPSPELPRPGTLAAAFGVAYVVEGSTLGGRVLHRRLSTQLRLPLRWTQGYGDMTGAMWREFCQLLAQHVRGEVAIAEAVACARATFISFRRCVLEGAPAQVEPAPRRPSPGAIALWS